MTYRFADCELDDANHTLRRAGRAVAVEPLVFDLLHLLVIHAGTLVSRDQAIDEIWQGRIISDSAFTACVAAARRAVGDDGKKQAVIRTVPRRGLMLVADVARDAAAKPDPAPLADPGSMRIRYARNANGESLAYSIAGSGPPVLYCRTIGMANLEAEWHSPTGRAFFEKLSDSHSVMRLDPLGSGLSDRNAPQHGFDRKAADVIAAADAAGWDRFAVYATSGACISAVHLAAHYPLRISKLVIVGGYAEGRVKRRATGEPDSLKTLLQEGWNEPEGAMAMGFLTTYFPEGPQEAVRDLVRMMQSASSPDVMLADRDAINNASVVDLLPKVRCPTLIVHGRDDGVHPLPQARMLAAGIPDAELLVLETANSLPLPGTAVWPTFISALSQFLAES